MALTTIRIFATYFDIHIVGKLSNTVGAILSHQTLQARTKFETIPTACFCFWNSSRSSPRAVSHRCDTLFFAQVVNRQVENYILRIFEVSHSLTRRSFAQQTLVMYFVENMLKVIGRKFLLISRRDLLPILFLWFLTPSHDMRIYVFAREEGTSKINLRFLTKNDANFPCFWVTISDTR